MDIDYKNPDYTAIFTRRIERLAYLRKHPADVRKLKAFYKEHPAQFISDWGMTVDPRNVELGLPSVIPFILFPKQIELVDWIVAHWKGRKPGLIEKSRDMGISWLTVATACTLCLFYPGMAIGFGSRKEEYVDKIGAPKSLFYKARVFVQNLPEEFRGSWDINKDAPHLRLNFPDSGSNISGEAGDNIGRGDRTGIYFVDEAAHIERAQLVEASLSQTTNCRIDLSSVAGMANVFAQKRHGGKIDVFIFDWRDDPRKDDAWYAKQELELDPITLNQEVNRDYNASVEGVVIPNAWVRASIDAHLKLELKPTGLRSGSLDVADEGKDKNAFCGAHGIVIEHIEEWTGKNSDIFATTQKAFNVCDLKGYSQFKFDWDGLGAGVRGDARIINENRATNQSTQIEVEAFRGSAGVFNPEGEDIKGRKNEDYFANCKAQAWWALRTRFQKTFRAVTEGLIYDPDELISISSSCGNDLLKLVAELSQPTWSTNGVGKVLIDKAPEGVKSPNLADAVMMQFSVVTRSPMRISKQALARAGR